MSEVEDQEETSELLGASRTARTVNSVDLNMEARHDHLLAKRFRLFYAVTVVLGFVLIILMFTWTINFLGGFAWKENPKLQFNWHPLLMTIGMIFLYAQSMLLYRTARGTKKRVLKLAHASVHFLVFIFTVIALQAVFDSHNLAIPPIPNLYSLHSWVGLTTVILFACQFSAGFITFLFPGLPMDLRGAYMHVHTSFGTAGFILAVLSAIMGIYEKLMFRLSTTYSELGSEATLINCIGMILIFFAVLVLYLVNEPTYKRTPLPEDDLLLSPTEPEIAE